MTVHQESISQLSFSSDINYPDLPSLEGKYGTQLIAQHAMKIFELIDGIGSPLHCVFPQQFSVNITHIQSVLAKHQLDARIFFSKKANKSQNFAKVCRESGIGVDVASKQELELALAVGITGEKLSVSGPEKDMAFLQLAFAHGVQIAVDSLEELQRIISLIASHNNNGDIQHVVKPTISLRFQPDCEKQSRFGISSTQLLTALKVLQPYQHQLRLLGFSFHLSGYDIQRRANVISELVKWVIKARELDFSSCNQINIGGGLPVKYVPTNKWKQFQRSIKTEHFHRQQSFANTFYPYGNEFGPAAALDYILSTPFPAHPTLSQLLRANKIQLAMEPGRALLDQAGVSIFKIQGVKLIESEHRYWIATVAGMSFSLSEQWFGSEFLPSPSLLKTNSMECRHDAATQAWFPTAIAGNSCLECDMVSWRKIPFTIKPAINDCLVYPNTAGYQMDSNESSFHSVPIIPKVAIWFDDQQIFWQLDSNI